jgi:hypothetical protein
LPDTALASRSFININVATCRLVSDKSPRKRVSGVVSMDLKVDMLRRSWLVGYERRCAGYFLSGKARLESTKE